MINDEFKRDLEEFEELGKNDQNIINNVNNSEMFNILKNIIDITKTREEILNRVMAYDDFANLFQIIKEYKLNSGKVIFNFDELLLSKTLIKEEDAVRFLEIEKNLFNKILKDNPIKAIIFIRKHCEDKTKLLLKGLLDLNSDDSIGVSGQRLAKIFLKVRNDIPIENRVQSLNSLLNIENDIIKVLITFQDIALTYQSNNDMTLILLAILESNIKDKRKEIKEKKEKLIEIDNKIEDKKEELNNLKIEITNLKEEKNNKEKEEIENKEKIEDDEEEMVE